MYSNCQRWNMFHNLWISYWKVRSRARFSMSDRASKKRIGSMSEFSLNEIHVCQSNQVSDKPIIRIHAFKYYRKCLSNLKDAFTNSVLVGFQINASSKLSDWLWMRVYDSLKPLSGGYWHKDFGPKFSLQKGNWYDSKVWFSRLWS